MSATIRNMPARVKRLLVSIVIALLLPCPGPHISDYIPVFWTLMRVGIRDPDAIAGGFYVVVGVAILFYTGVVFAILTIIASLRARHARGS